MEKLNIITAEMAEKNIEMLGQMFPNCLTEKKNDEGKIVKAIDFDKLRQELTDSVVEGPEERYQFTWPDKRNAIRLANAPTTKTLRPCREESVDFDNTQNLYIEGDNLDVLKILRENYLGKVKMIYIDPPYNTGKDFVYNDDFTQTSAEYASGSGQLDIEGNRLVLNSESNGRFHTDWLNMIYPRLKVARDLLTDDGLIFISIGEQEIDNLKKVCNEIFGAHNNIETYVWESTFRPDNSSLIMRRNAEYVLCFAKNIHRIKRLIGEIKSKEGLPSLTKSSMKESILHFPAQTVITYLDDGEYYAGSRDSYTLLDDVIVKDGVIQNDFRLKGRMIWGQSNLEKEIANGTKIIIKGNGFVPYTDKGGDSIMSPCKLIPNNKVGDVLSANAEMALLFPKKVFSYPKPVSLLSYLIHYLEESDYIVLDFFSGSSTTAHAVIEQNSIDGGKRRFIAVQLPEDLDENLARSTDKEVVVIQNAIELCDELKVNHKITEIGKERIRRAGRKILTEVLSGRGCLDGTGYGVGIDNYEEYVKATGDRVLDIGFRVLKLDSANEKEVKRTPSEVPVEQGLFDAMLDDMVENIKEDRTPEDLLFQVLPMCNLPLSCKIETKEIDGKCVFIVEDGYLIACFDDEINENVITEIAKMKPYYFVMRDSSLATDNVADNFDQIFNAYSKDTIRRIL